MTTLRDEFDKTHSKDGFTYVSWSQVADRLDEAAPDAWSFEVLQLDHSGWALGRLILNGKNYDNIGYAENVDATWKKEPLKDAVSDAFKRCAALAGVARYLYDKDSSNGTGRAGPSSPARPAAAPARTLTAVPDDVDPYADLKPEWDQGAANPQGGSGWTFGQLAKAAEAQGIEKNKIYQTADSLFGPKTKVTDLTGAQREQIAFEMGLT